MIVFDLACGRAHVFEAWFRGSGEYDDQRRRDLIACPLCGDRRIDKAVMAPAVAPKGNRQPTTPHPDLGALLAAQRRMEAGSEYVGCRFAVEARRRHADSNAMPVHGEASIAEARALLSDGIPVLPLPFRPLAASDS